MSATFRKRSRQRLNDATVVKKLVPVEFPAPVRPGLETRSSVQTVAFPHCVICHAHPFTVLPDINLLSQGQGRRAGRGWWGSEGNL